MKNNKGFATVLVYAVVAVVGVFMLVPTWHLPSFLQKKPPTKQLSVAEQQLVVTQAQLAKAQSDLAAAKAADEKNKSDQLTYSHQMTTAASDSLNKVPAAHITPEVVLAKALLDRANNGLDAAIGALPADKQAEMKALVEQALSAKQAEIDAANASLADMDKKLAAETSARAAVDKQIPSLQSAVSVGQAEVKEKQAEVDKQTAAVAAYADKSAAEKAEAGSLKTYSDNLVRWLIIIGVVYLLIHFILPSLVAEFPAFKILDTFYRGLTSIFSAHALAPVTTAPATPVLPTTTTQPTTH